jgi:site-specific DNA recombinase
MGDINQRLDGLYDAVETGKLSLNDLSPRIKQLKERKERLEAQKWELEWQLKERRVELADVEMVTRHVKDLQALIEENTVAERKLKLQEIL